jgi:hypothetical protein
MRPALAASASNRLTERSAVRKSGKTANQHGTVQTWHVATVNRIFYVKRKKQPKLKYCSRAKVSLGCNCQSRYPHPITRA